MPTQPVSTVAQAIQGANDPTQTTSTQQGFYTAPNAFFKAMNQQTLTSFTTLSNGSVGSFLQQHKLVNGDIATIINASLDYVLADKSKSLPDISPNVNYTNTKRTFIPIIFKTDFDYTKTNYIKDNKNITTATPLYIIFDSTPENISFTKAANWSPTNFLGRSEPIFTYQNSSEIRFDLTGKFYAESYDKHKELLKLADYIMALSYPSQNNFMPSPITVFIGEWKALRCLVANVTIKYAGPWKINVSTDDYNNAATTASKNVISNAINNNTFNGSIPSHTPYYFEATFSLIVVNKDNDLSYAEQIISTGFAKGETLDFTDTSNPETIALLKSISSLFPTTGTSTVTNTGLYSVTSQANNYTFSNGQISNYTEAAFTYTTAAQNMNLYAGSNASSRLSDQGIISNAVNSQMLSLFQKAVPSSTNTPGVTKSLNPFSKLF